MSAEEKGRYPTGFVYTIVEKEGKDDRWIRIGAAWLNRDHSLNIELDALPVNGHLQVRAPREKDGEGATADDEG